MWLQRAVTKTYGLAVGLRVEQIPKATRAVTGFVGLGCAKRGEGRAPAVFLPGPAPAFERAAAAGAVGGRQHASCRSPVHRLSGSSGPGKASSARRRNASCLVKREQASQTLTCRRSAILSGKESRRSMPSEISRLASLQERRIDILIASSSRGESSRRTRFAPGRRASSTGLDTASPSSWTQKSRVPYRFHPSPGPSARAR
jgi:hypothetical protein